MTFYKRDALQDLSDLLTTVAVSIALKKALGFYDDLQIVEDFFAGFLSRLWNRNYVNENLFKQNVAAIDLSDRAAKAAVQVTSDTSTRKIRVTLEKFISHGLGKDFDELRFVYPVVKKPLHRRSADPLPATPVFHLEDGVSDISDLIRECRALPTEKLVDLCDWTRGEVTRVSGSQRVADAQWEAFNALGVLLSSWEAQFARLWAERDAMDPGNDHFDILSRKAVPLGDALDAYLDKHGHVAPTNVTKNLQSARDDFRRSDSIALRQEFYGGEEEELALGAWSKFESAIGMYRCILGLRDAD